MANKDVVATGVFEFSKSGFKHEVIAGPAMRKITSWHYVQNIVHFKDMNTIALSDLRTNLPTVIDKIADGLDRLIVTVSGKPKAILMSLEEAEIIDETAEILSVPGALKEIKEGWKEARQGKGTPLRLSINCCIWRKSPMRRKNWVGN